MAALLDAPHGRRLGMGEGFSADLRAAQDASVGIRQTQLLRHLRSGRGRHESIAERSWRRSYSDGHRLSALRFGISTHGIRHHGTLGFDEAPKRENLRRKRREAAKSVDV